MTLHRPGQLPFATEGIRMPRTMSASLCTLSGGFGVCGWVAGKCGASAVYCGQSMQGSGYRQGVKWVTRCAR